MLELLSDRGGPRTFFLGGGGGEGSYNLIYIKSFRIRHTALEEKLCHENYISAVIAVMYLYVQCTYIYSTVYCVVYMYHPKICLQIWFTEDSVLTLLCKTGP